MDKETNQENPSHLPNNITTTTTITTTTVTAKEESPRKPLGSSGGGGGTNNIGGSGGGGGGGDRLKRDEWSEGAVSSLLEAYEKKWVLRNRAKLKGHDWEDVARYVSSRSNSTKSPKTQTQCKNKIESMKKRYRSESATADASSWPLYPRLDLLLRGNGPSPVALAATAASVVPQPQNPVPAAVLPAPPPQPPNPPLMLLEPSPLVPHQPPPPPQPPLSSLAPPPHGAQQNSDGSNGVGRTKEDGAGINLSDNGSDKNNPQVIETDSSTPALYSEKERLRTKKMKMKMEKKNVKRRRKEQYGVAESIRWLAEVVVKSEQARMETMREIERMRVEAEAKRGEMDLKRTEIIANTQLEIARLFAAGVGKGVDSSLRIGRN
ncbi:trihelix transcription factor ASIL2 [Ziziphus jujuba]|uniref:Trihelix transcription factor ASIL2 n=1 Tax=Ziziphus jujuba TaxID=326968 RepID=A0ABM3IEU3_ZIZJJ|nr:trihelix transcription factor ASIL2 [Ziziphus jujuba]